MDYKYIVLNSEGDLTLKQVRPTQEQIKGWELGTYTLLRPDASVAKIYAVTLNRNGNHAVSATPPGTLTGLSDARLNRLSRHLAEVVKIWPEKAKDFDLVNKVIANRQSLLQRIEESAMVLSEPIDWSGAVQAMDAEGGVES